jgi:gluconate kinase
MKDLSGWTPARVYWQDSRPMVDWAYLGNCRFTEPFFTQTIDRCVRRPADLLFRHQIPLAELGIIAGSRPSLPPTGFIFHMSRCGSTLISQMLAAAPENIVLSEAGPIDLILRAHFRNPEISDEQRVQWLRWMVEALSWQRHESEKHVFIKFDCWHTLFLPLIQRAFPAVPWIFVYREPLEVMVSQLGRRGGHMVPGVLEPELFGWDLTATTQTTLNEYGARVLAKICGAALRQFPCGNAKLLNYHQLPEGIWPALMEHWQVKFSGGETARMMAASRMDAKNPVIPFTPDSDPKRAAATPELRSLTHQYLDAAYQKLESQRRTHGFS